MEVETTERELEEVDAISVAQGHYAAEKGGVAGVLPLAGHESTWYLY